MTRRKVLERWEKDRELTLYKALISSVMIYASPTWEYAADALLLKPQRVQSRVLRAIGNLGDLYRRTRDRELRVAFKIPYVYDYVGKLCSTPAEAILNCVNPTVRGIGQGEAMHTKYKKLMLGGGQSYDVQLRNCSFRVVTEIKA
jgi:hypothetical protein